LLAALAYHLWAGTRNFRLVEMRSQVEDTGVQARELAATAEQLRELVARFKLTEEPAPARLQTPTQRLRAA
jgi:hypothetical protein